MEATKLSLTPVEEYKLTSEKEILDFLENKEKEDKTFEGFVIFDGQQRIKIKSKEYVSIHYNFFSRNIFLDKNLISLILKGESSEVLSYYPELNSRIDELKSQINQHKFLADIKWHANKHLKDRKTFSLQVKDSIYSRYLFQSFSLGVVPSELMNDEQFFIEILG